MVDSLLSTGPTRLVLADPDEIREGLLYKDALCICGTGYLTYNFTVHPLLNEGLIPHLLDLNQKETLFVVGFSFLSFKHLQFVFLECGLFHV